MQKNISLLVALVLFVSTAMPGVTLAQSSVDANLQKIQELLAQIRELQATINKLIAQQNELRASANEVIVDIVQGLREGSRGDQVTLLQTLLAADTALYPEGLVTGYFGPLTRRALQRFQARVGLETVGFIGPRTRAELNKLIRKEFKFIEDLEDDLDDDDVAEDIEQAIAAVAIPPLPSDACGIPALPSITGVHIESDGKTKLIQTGNVFIYKDGDHKVIITPNTYHEKDGKKKLLITPGMRIEKDGKFKSIVPCNRATTTPPIPPSPPSPSDTTAPTLSSIGVSLITHQSAAVSWTTNELAKGKVYYGTTTPLDLGTAQMLADATQKTTHSFGLVGLAATTTHYLVVESTDASGNTSTSTEQSFTTSAVPDTTPPLISAVSVAPASTTASVMWSTDEAATSKAYYGTTTPLVLGSATSASDGAFVTSHVLELTGLGTSTTYFAVVESKDASNNTAVSSEVSFATGI